MVVKLKNRRDYLEKKHNNEGCSNNFSSNVIFGFYNNANTLSIVR